MIVSHPDAYQRRTRNLPPGQGLATLDLRQTLAPVGEPEYGESLGDGMASWHLHVDVRLMDCCLTSTFRGLPKKVHIAHLDISPIL